MSPLPVRNTVLAGLTAAVLANPIAAQAAGTHAAHLAERPAHAAKVTVHGLVVQRHGARLTVLADEVTVGETVHHDVVEHLTLHGTSRAARNARAGYVISATGVMHGKRIDRVAIQASSAQSGGVLLGTVESVQGSIVSLCGVDGANGHHHGRANHASARSRRANHHHRHHGCDSSTVTADLSDASMIGAAGGPAQLVAGDYIVVLGEQLQGVFVAAQAISYSSQPAFVVGLVTAANADTNSLTVSARHCDEDEDVTDGGVQVDTTVAQIVVNGAQDGSFPKVGDEVLVLGQDGAATDGAALPASFVYAFNARNDHPVGDDGGDDSGDGRGDGGGDGQGSGGD